VRNNNSLQLLLELEQQREDKLAQEYGRAQHELALIQQRMRGMEQYRLDYLKQLNQRGADGIQSQHFGHYHAFIGKLDVGVQQLGKSMFNARKAVEQRKQLWLKQRQQREAVAHLIKQRAIREDKVVAKREQNQLDEFSSNQRIRNLRQNA